jgi:glutamyl/glutaminyl-tRNA synthetase
MKISHVLRGDEHLPNAAKQILLARALKFENPEFGHLPLILNADRSKMSKRKNPVSVTDDYRAKGYLPEALVNFLALLGWSSGTDQEIFSMQELIREFRIDRVGKSPAIFDQEKLLWMNGYYIRNSDLGKIAYLTQEFISDKTLRREVENDTHRYLEVIALIKDRLKTLADVEKLITFFYRRPDYPAALLIARQSDKQRTQKALKVAEQTLKGIDQYTIDATEVALRKAARDAGLKDGELLWAVRVALSGSEASPGVFELLEVFGKKESLERISIALKKLDHF